MPTTTDAAAALAIGNRRDEIAAFIALMRSGIEPAHKIATIAEEVGSAVFLVQKSEMDRFRGIADASHAFAGAIHRDDISRAVREVDEWLQQGLDVRSVLDSSFPTNLRMIFDRPPLLFVRGQWLEERDSRAIAVVGTREPTARGIELARRITSEITSAGFTVLSGLAAGIDTVAHQTTLDLRGRTAAVLGTGIRRVYPAQNAPLAGAIIEANGALVSSFLPDQPPEKWTFPARNVVMSGLAIATVVVEAGATSGAKLQARFALQHGRAVFLPKSLVGSHDWAAEYVRSGRYGSRAIEFESPDEIIARIDEEVFAGADVQ